MVHLFFEVPAFKVGALELVQDLDDEDVVDLESEESEAEESCIKRPCFIFS